MTTATGYAPSALVQGVSRQPLPYGLFSVLSFRPGADRWQNGVRWESGTCDPVTIIGAPECAPDENGRTTGYGYPKVLDPNGGDLGEATPFTVYGHYRCSAPSMSVEEAEAFAQAHLLTREEAAVEKEFWTGLAGSRPALQAEIVVEDYGQSRAVNALASLEGFIGSHYGSLGVLHMGRDTATSLIARQMLTTSGGKLSTLLGTPVVAGAGYPTGTGDIYATPAMLGYRTDVFSPSSERGDLIDRATNTLTAIAERSYLIGYDPCGVAKASIDLSATYSTL